MSISDGLGRYIFCRRMEKTRTVREEMNGKVFYSRQNRHFLFIVNMTKVRFTTCTLIWREKHLRFPPRKRCEKEKRMY